MGTTASNLAPAGVADLEPDTRGAVHSRAGLEHCLLESEVLHELHCHLQSVCLCQQLHAT